MNIKLNLSFNNGLLDTGGNPVSLVGTISEDMLLSPFYATENDVLSVIMDDPEDAHKQKVREIIFNSSIVADDKITNSVMAEWDIPADQAFRIKRQYVICMSVYEFSKGFYRDYLRAIKKSKFLGDVKVSLDIEKDPSFIMQISNDAKDCFEEITDSLTGGTGMSSFVKGRSNSCNIVSNRQWFPGLGRGMPRIPIAASKASAFCAKYKIGIA